MTTSISHSLLTAARDAAWSGDHARAAALCTEGLAEGNLDPAVQLDLLDTRAESFVAQGQFDCVAQDAAAMIGIAKCEDKPAYLAQALNRQVIVQLLQGKLDDSVLTAGEAMQAARDSGQERLAAMSLHRLAHAQDMAGEYASSVNTAVQARDLYHKLGDLSGEARTLTVQAVSSSD